MKVVGLCIVLMLGLTWHQPTALLSLARMIECLAIWAVSRMRWRAWALEEANASYRQAMERFREQAK